MTPAGIDWFTYLGSRHTDVCYGVTSDYENSIYVTGYSAGQDFPIWNLAGAYNQQLINLTGDSGQYDGFITKFDISYTTGAGISEVKKEQMMSVFPNPVSNTLFFKNQLDAENYSITVFNMYGQVVFTSQNFVTSIDVSGFAAGVYIFQYKADNFTGYTKFIKQ